MTVFRVPVKSGGEIVAWALVDESDFENVRRYSWSLQKSAYAVRATPPSGTRSMHRDVLGLAKGDPRVAHHRNEDPLDNRRENLQVFASNGEHLVAPHPKSRESRRLRCIVAEARYAHLKRQAA